MCDKFFIFLMGSSRASSGREICTFIDRISGTWILKLRETEWDTHTVPGMPLLFYSMIHVFVIYDMFTWTRDKWFRRYHMKCYYLPENPSLRAKLFYQDRDRITLVRDKTFFAIRVNWLITHHSKLNTHVRIYLLFYSHLIKNNQN